MPALPLLELGPDPLERGVVQGRQMARQIRSNLETYLARFAASGSGRDAVFQEAERWSAFIARDSVEYAEEMAGIADGAGLSITEIALLNARYEITYCLYAKDARSVNLTDLPEQEGCTVFALLPEVTRSGHCLIGENWDWLQGLRGNVLIKRIRRSGGPNEGRPDFIGFTEAGIVGCKMGVNEAGIGLCVAGLVTDREGRNGLRKPMHVRCAEVLDAWTYAEALRPIVETDRTCSTNFLIAHADGEIVDIEATPELCAYIYPGDGLLTHANHLERELRIASQFERITPSTLFRARRLRRSLEADRGAIDLASLKASLSDHFSAPMAICLHPNPKLPEARRNVTVASIVIDLQERVLYATDGPPCEAEYQAFALKAPQVREQAGMAGEVVWEASDG